VSSDLAEDLRGLVEWRRVPAPKRPASLRFACFYVLAGVRLRRLHAELVHTLGAIVPNAAQLATVQFCHAGFCEAAGGLSPPGAPPLRRLNTGLARALCLLAERWSYRRGRVDVLAAVSSGIAGELRRFYPQLPTVVAPNGVDRRRFRPDPRARAEVRVALRLAPDEVVALFVGGDWDRKGLALVVAGLAHARRHARVQPSLLVVGRGDTARFRRLAAAHGVAGHVTFVDARPDVERFYAAADVFVFPTLYEAFPLVALEAAASGLPIVAPPANGIADLLGHGDAGLLVERDSVAIGVALARLADDAALRARLGTGARTRSRSFTWPRVIAPLERAYDDLVRRGAAA
jgi:UDP-glucose:(heptosyl)LPS alpha-1,3-glucosyltransferase